MTTNDIRTIIYNYHDKATADIIVKWATKYMEEHNTTLDYAMAVTLLEIHKRSN